MNGEVPKHLSSLILAKSKRDLNFKAKILKDPKKAIKEELAFEFPNEIEIKIIENTNNLYYIVLPYSDSELGEEELKSIAGGVTSNDTKPSWQNLREDMGKLRSDLRKVRQDLMKD